MRAPTPVIAVPGRLSPHATNVRGEAFAAGQGYLRGIGRAGGQGVILPPIVAGLETSDGFDSLVETLSRFDGIVLHGGGDVDPTLYGEAPTAEELYGIIPEHDAYELAVVRAALELDMPVLAICRGLQILNVALGGTRNQDIGTESHWHTFHPVGLDAGSRLAEAMGTTRPEACHSVHHQSLKAVAPGLQIVGHADDGLDEAAEYDAKTWVVGVQWHPEDNAADDPVQQRLFDALVGQAQDRSTRATPQRPTSMVGGLGSGRDAR